MLTTITLAFTYRPNYLENRAFIHSHSSSSYTILTFLILDFSLDIFDSVTGFHLKKSLMQDLSSRSFGHLTDLWLGIQCRPVIAVLHRLIV